jgi:hypothetical protein
MNAAGFDLGQVNEQRGEQLIRLSQSPGIRELVIRALTGFRRPK